MITETIRTEYGFLRTKWIGSIENTQREKTILKTMVEFFLYKKIVSYELNNVYKWRYRWRYRLLFNGNINKFIPKKYTKLAKS